MKNPKIPKQTTNLFVGVVASSVDTIRHVLLVANDCLSLFVCARNYYYRSCAEGAAAATAAAAHTSTPNTIYVFVVSNFIVVGKPKWQPNMTLYIHFLFYISFF